MHVSDAVTAGWTAFWWIVFGGLFLVDCFGWTVLGGLLIWTCQVSKVAVCVSAGPGSSLLAQGASGRRNPHTHTNKQLHRLRQAVKEP